MPETMPETTIDPIQDSRLLAYSVDAEKKEIRFQMLLSDEETELRSEAVFHGVVAYQFIHDRFENVLYGIDETDPGDIFEMNWELFESEKDYGWPGAWARSPEAARSYFDEQGINGWIVTASLGLNGWVLAKSLEIRTSETQTELVSSADAVSFAELAPVVLSLSIFAKSGDDAADPKGRLTYSNELENGWNVVFVMGEDEHPDALRIYENETLLAWAAFFDEEIVALEHPELLIEAAEIASSIGPA